MDIDKKFWARVDKTGSCWVWTGPKRGVGYGVISVDSKPKAVHRFAYELLVGPIPEGLVLDHLCRNRLCVRPEHLEAVTQQVNILRGVGYTAVAARKTHCKRGHEYTPENTVKATNGRWCRECRKAWARADAAKRRAAAKAS